MVFYTCGICEIESGLSTLHVLDDVILERIRASDMPYLYAELIKDMECEDVRNCDRAYAQAAFVELTEDGLLKGCSHVCKACVRQLPKLKSNAAVAALELVGDFEAEVDCENSDIESLDNVCDSEADESVGAAEPLRGSRNGSVPRLALVNGYFRGILSSFFMCDMHHP